MNFKKNLFISLGLHLLVFYGLWQLKKDKTVFNKNDKIQIEIIEPSKGILRLDQIFPVPVVYLNIPWAQENWDRIVNSEDSLSEFKKEFGKQ